MASSPWPVLAVAAGGTVGTLGRYAVSHVIGADHLLPWGTLVVNVVGAFLLGLLLETLARSGREGATHRMVRLALGTGVLGGFTTYSALALQTHDLLLAGHVGLAVGYGGGTVVAGLLAATLGIVLATRWRRAAGPTSGTVVDR